MDFAAIIDGVESFAAYVGELASVIGHVGRVAPPWPEIIADLDSLTETEIGHDGKRFTVRSAPRPAAGLAIRRAAAHRARGLSLIQ
jgi:hypothetical protein